MNKLILILLSICLAAPAFALEEIQKNYRGARSLGMGGVTFSTGIYDEALFANPAMHVESPSWKLTILGITAEANSNLLTDLNDVIKAKGSSGAGVITTVADKGLAGKNEHTRLGLMVPGFYSPRFFGDNTGFAFGLLMNSQVNLMLRSNAAIDTQAIVDIGPNFGVAHKMLDDRLSLGINLHLLYRIATDKAVLATEFLTGSKLSFNSLGGQGIGIDGDIGALYKLPVETFLTKRLAFALSLNNLAGSTYSVFGNNQIKTIDARPPDNDRTVNTGVRLDLQDAWLFQESLLALEMQNIGSTRRAASFFKKFHIGGETHLFGKFLALRAGLNQGYIGGGLGFDIPVVKIDLATYGEELGTNPGILEDRRYVLKLSIDI